jgi:hypothetical protein
MMSLLRSRRVWIAAVACFILLSLLTWPSAQNYRQYYRSLALLESYYAQAPLSFGNAVGHASQDADATGDKVIVMARTQNENTDWVAQNLPE